MTIEVKILQVRSIPLWCSALSPKHWADDIRTVYEERRHQTGRRARLLCARYRDEPVAYALFYMRAVDNELAFILLEVGRRGGEPVEAMPASDRGLEHMMRWGFKKEPSGVWSWTRPTGDLDSEQGSGKARRNGT